MRVTAVTRIAIGHLYPSSSAAAFRRGTLSATVQHGNREDEG